MALLMKKQGFTLVELATVIAILGVLAAIVIVSYGSWRTSVTTANIKSDLNGAVAAMESARNFSNVYPLTVPSTFVASSGISLGGGSTDGKNYCIYARNSDSSIIYHVTNGNTTPQPNGC